MRQPLPASSAREALDSNQYQTSEEDHPGPRLGVKPPSYLGLVSWQLLPTPSFASTYLVRNPKMGIILKRVGRRNGWKVLLRSWKGPEEGGSG